MLEWLRCACGLDWLSAVAFVLRICNCIPDFDNVSHPEIQVDLLGVVIYNVQVHPCRRHLVQTHHIPRYFSTVGSPAKVCGQIVSADKIHNDTRHSELSGQSPYRHKDLVRTIKTYERTTEFVRCLSLSSAQLQRGSDQPQQASQQHRHNLHCPICCRHSWKMVSTRMKRTQNPVWTFLRSICIEDDLIDVECKVPNRRSMIDYGRTSRKQGLIRVSIFRAIKMHQLDRFHRLVWSE